MPKVTVLLTSYNHADYLDMSINSVLNQTYKDFELIIIDDCSTDDSWSIIDKYKDKRIKKIRNKKNMGSILKETLVDGFKGEYFAVAHCDDMWEPSKLEKQVDFLEKNKKYAACFTWVKLIDENNKKISSENYVDFNVENKDRFGWLNYFFYKGNCLCHPSLLMRTKIQKSEKLYTMGLGALPDLYRWVKLCLKHEIYVYPEKLSYFRIRKAGMNTSGYNYNNIVRVSFDMYKILGLYKNLNKVDFIKVFPQSKKYDKNGYFNKNFLLGRICIDEFELSNYRLFGLNCIYEELQKSRELKKIELNYQYVEKNFVEEVGKNDIFNIIDKDIINISSIYFSFEDGYNENNKISKTYLLKSDGNFEVLFNDINLKANKIRFDPDEGKFQRYSDINIFVNGKKIPFKTNGKKIQESKYEFYNFDPYFELKYSGLIENIYVTGKCETLSSDIAFSKLRDQITVEVTKQTVDYINSQKICNRIRNKIKHIISKI